MQWRASHHPLEERTTAGSLATGALHRAGAQRGSVHRGVLRPTLHWPPALLPASHTAPPALSASRDRSLPAACRLGDPNPEPSRACPGGRWEAGGGASLSSRAQSALRCFSNNRMFATHFSFTVSSLKMCTVSVLLEAERNMPSMLKASEQMLTHLGAEGRGHRAPGHQPPPQGL